MQPSYTSTKKRKAVYLLQQLRKRYPTIPTLLEAGNPWEHLIATILSAQSTDARVNSITPQFFERWKTPYDLAQATQEEVEQVIRPVGFYRNKAKNIIATAKKIVDVFDGEVPRTMEELTSLHGVARKTANCVLATQFGIHVGIAVDTHVQRIMRNVGIAKGTTAEKIEQELMPLFPQKDWGDLNKMCVWFGREVCIARSPTCSSCPVQCICNKYHHVHV